MPVAAIAVPPGFWDVPIEAAAIGVALRQALAMLVQAPIPDRVNLALIRLGEGEAMSPYWRRYY